MLEYVRRFNFVHTCMAGSGRLFPGAKMKSMAKSGQSPQKNFETALAELEQIVGQLENGQLSLDDSLAAYKQGIELLQYCQKTLQAAEQQVQVLENGVLRNLTDEN